MLEAGQLVLYCLLPFPAAGVVWGAAAGIGLPATAALSLAAGAGGAVGVVLAVQMQRGLAVAGTALDRLRQGLPAIPARPQGSWPVSRLLERIVALGASESRLGAVREQLLSQTAAAAAQEERNRLARDLHDSIKQQIYAVSVNAATAQARWGQDPDGAQAALAEVRRSAQEAMVEMQAMLQQLRPAPLENVGLQEALREQGEALGYQTGAAVEMALGQLPDDERLPLGSQESLFRIAQEAFGNVARHARAGHVQVAVRVAAEGERDLLLLEVRDDGQGFDVRAQTGGAGLTNMSERIRALGGTLEVRSARGEGTTIRASVPLQPPDQPSGHARRIVWSRGRVIAVVVAGATAATAVMVAATDNPVGAAVVLLAVPLAAAAVLRRGR
jgi:signal transduction histidine kinase